MTDLEGGTRLRFNPRRAIPRLLFLVFLAGGVFFSLKKWAPGCGSSLFGGRDVASSAVPEQLTLPAANAAPIASSASAPVAGGRFPQLSSYDFRPGCANLPEVRVELWAWNAQMGGMFANGGLQSTVGSLMCKHGVNVKFVHQEDVPKMREDLVTFASRHAGGEDNPSDGVHFVAIMGDGSPAFLHDLNDNAQFKRLGAEYRAQVVGSMGYSRGEDKFMGPPAWRDNHEAARGGVVSGVLRDGDWNIALMWLANNGICNNPDERTYDPNCLNWVATDSYTDAAQKYVSGYCEDRQVKGHPGQTHHTCVQGTVTWTPGDVTVAQERGGLVSLLSTKENLFQMPNTLIGIRHWMTMHREQVEGMLAAMFEGAEAVRSSDVALRRAAAISAVVYGDQNAEYWYKYYLGVTERDRTGLMVPLGGSAVNTLADNCYLFGLSCAPGSSNIFAAVYTSFGRLVVQQYPSLVPSIIPVEQVLDTSYVEAIAARAGAVGQAERPTFREDAPVRQALMTKNWSVNFISGQAALTPQGARLLRDEVYPALITSGGLAIEIHGHTDGAGDAEANRELSRQRAMAVRTFLQQLSPANFPASRVLVQGHGEDMPIASNDTVEGKSQNRRVEIVLGTQ